MTDYISTSAAFLTMFAYTGNSQMHSIVSHVISIQQTPRSLVLRISMTTSRYKSWSVNKQ